MGLRSARRARTACQRQESTSRVSGGEWVGFEFSGAIRPGEVLHLRRVWPCRGCEESSAVWGRTRIEVIPHAVNHNVVVEPAEGGEVVDFGGTALRERHDVMRLEPIAAGTAVDDTSLVSPEDEPFEPGWDSC